jgi:hypothetical protein
LLMVSNKLVQKKAIGTSTGSTTYFGAELTA